MIRGILQNELFYLNHLGSSEHDEKEIQSFRVDNAKGLEHYIHFSAMPDENAGIMRSYLVRSIADDSLVSYFSLKAGLISLNEVKTENGVTFDTLPGVEIADFAVNSGFLERHTYLRGTGAVVFSDFIIPTIMKATEHM